MRRFLPVVLGALSIGLAAPAWAQDADTTAGSAKRLELARELVAESGGVAAAEAQMKALFSQSSEILKSSVPAGQSRVAEAMMTYMQDEYLKVVPEMLDGSAIVYARHLTEAELRGLLAWTKSEVGRSLNAKMPVIMQDMMVQQAPLTKKLISGIMKTAADRACEEVACTSKERETIAQILRKSSPPAS